MSAPRSSWPRRAKLPLLALVSVWIVDRLRAPLSAAGIEFDKFRAILANRLWLETRATHPDGSQLASPALGLAMVGAIAALSGVGAGVVALATKDVMLWLLAGLGMWGLWLLLLTLGHFANLLVDGVDIQVLAGLPVRDRTVLAARLAHVAVYTLVLTACASFAPIAMGAFVLPWTSVLIVYPLGALLTAVWVVGGVATLFAIALRAFGVKHFQRLTFWLQVSGGALVVLVLQLAPQLLPRRELLEVAEHSLFVRALVPALCFENLDRVLRGSRETEDFVLSALALTLPLAVTALGLFLARGRYIAALSDAGVATVGGARGFRPSWLARQGLARCSGPSARATFGWALALMRREKTFLRGVAPQAVLFLTMIVISVAAPSREVGRFDPSYAPLSLYMMAFATATGFFVAEFSEHARASVQFEVLPSRSMSALLEGAAKALIVGFALPLLGATTLVTAAVAGPRHWPSVALAAAGTLWLQLVLARRVLTKLPFSAAPGAMPPPDRVAWMLAILVPVAGLVLAHLALALHPAALAAGIAFYAWRAHAAWRALERIQPQRR